MQRAVLPARCNYWNYMDPGGPFSTKGPLKLASQGPFWGPFGDLWRSRRVPWALVNDQISVITWSDGQQNKKHQRLTLIGPFLIYQHFNFQIAETDLNWSISKVIYIFIFSNTSGWFELVHFLIYINISIFKHQRLIKIGSFLKIYQHFFFITIEVDLIWSNSSDVSTYLLHHICFQTQEAYLDFLRYIKKFIFKHQMLT